MIYQTPTRKKMVLNCSCHISESMRSANLLLVRSIQSHCGLVWLSIAGKYLNPQLVGALVCLLQRPSFIDTRTTIRWKTELGHWSGGWPILGSIDKAQIIILIISSVLTQRHAGADSNQEESDLTCLMNDLTSTRVTNSKWVIIQWKVLQPLELYDLIRFKQIISY